MDKHSSLLRTFVNYGRKKSYNIGPGFFFKLLPEILVLSIFSATDSFQIFKHSFASVHKNTTKLLLHGSAIS
jgi:hypothetical protein